MPDEIVAIAATCFTNVHLRMDGGGVTHAVDVGAGTVNCQYGVGPYEKFCLHRQSNGTVTIESMQFPGVFLRLDGNGVTQPAGSGAGIVNCQFGAGPWEQFYFHQQSDGTVTIESAAFPGVFLRLDGSGVTQPIDAGAGTVNCQFGAGPYEHYRLLPQGQRVMGDIEHIVVLMLENRSFDGMLGWLYEHDAPAVNIPPATADDTFRGLQGVDLSTFTNRADYGLSSPPSRGAAGFTVPSITPGEEFKNVNMQFFGTETPTAGAKATMTGVLQDFVNTMQHHHYGQSDIEANAGMVMQSYTPGQLPVMNQLARHYAVCDDWFASVPSQTNPNRAFLMTGSSHGLVNNGQLEIDPQAKELEKVLGMGIGDDRFPEDTIFNALAAANADWAVFWQSSYLPHKISALLNNLPRLALLTRLMNPVLSTALQVLLAALKPYTQYINSMASGELTSNYTWRLFPAIHKISGADRHFKSVDQFHALARSGNLPKFSYIEPSWTIAETSTDGGLKNLLTQMGNDYHPPGNMIVAENFVKDVYSSLIANQAAWNKTLLVITFDEFVGSFDHVAPPAAVPPWGAAKPDFTTNGFGFDRFGARVPTLLVSPLVQKGTVFRSPTSTPYDHTSILATTLKWLGQADQAASFGERTRHAPTFDNVVTLKQPRTDAADIGFLKVARKIGDPVQYGDPILLKNQHGNYVTLSQSATKVSSGLPDGDLMHFAIDLNLAAHFPTLGSGNKAVLTLRTPQADPPAQIDDGSSLFIVTLEAEVGGANFLGAWSDSHDCYYYNMYVQGSYMANETWIVKQADRHGQGLKYGDRVYFENAHFGGQRLSQDSRPFQGTWISTTSGHGDYWTIEPAVS
ncbi:Non-hemolytic phospholipase C [Burkholderia glumae]|nr:alkaline phosphatase family protein [Burkholderia glumae]MCR1771051.1 hypothetical protein [Burkholderia glumae]QHP93558.1 hypothetical protein EXE55_21955 [Burkholderia glumae]QKM51234.1 Non-hemolytic phospholipase C [Burkholderia glumae]